ncbi:MAG: bifunctional methylenetetrahydrofolate dehydrogenase/methenyltetrahydrofolate cyclohydrolase FolD [Bacteroidales bacterium]|nr:bifunctional methylenetetrahydrofolate dehydrogenase/methenyltetrahydrofolate cyclohydrolase FolD [Candidatus Scybalousia scybalohippi]MCQ2326160.1 bifunctional methylenetetrahydrofolate dehydrogenase/methenyltetrahydrofolate cyclohydrolase FolD [Bacteroidales bacterium]
MAEQKPIFIDGKKIASEIKEEIKKEVADMLDHGQRPPHLVAVLVGEDGASLSYVKSKEKQSQEVGFTSSVYRFPATISEEELLQTIDFLNKDNEVDGYIVQMPLPKHIDARKITDRIDPRKDVDGFHPVNVGRMVLSLPSYIPATPYGIVTLIERSGIETQGKHCVVIGRSDIVGTPVSLLMSRKGKHSDCTVTLCHSKTENLKEICLQADIIIVAIGKPAFLKAEMVKEGAVVIDVGIHRIPDDSEKGYYVTGDVDFEEVSKKCSYITPVPGGVGPMTIVSLLTNTLRAYKKEVYKD